MNSEKKGSIHLVLMGGVFLLMLLGLRFAEEHSDFKYRRAEMEALLAFEYRLEAYYLLILADELKIEEGVSYGSLEGYEVAEKPEGAFVIEFQKNHRTVEIVGLYAEKERQRYSIKR